jgi:peptidoglycan/LPS O-acetylase OafA/YrhL
VTARVFRVYPIVMLSFCLAALDQWFNNPLGSSLAEARFDVLRFLAQLALVDVSWNDTLWALQVEMLMVPAILCVYFFERRVGPRALVALALLTTVLSFDKHWALWPPLSRNVFAFLVGMGIPTVGRTVVSRMTQTSANRWLAGAVLTMVVSAPLLGIFSPVSAVVETYASAVLVSLAAYRSNLWGGGLLDTKPLRLLGLSSGSMYVLHAPTLRAAIVVAAAVIPASWSASAPAAVGFIVIGPWLLALAPCMLATYYLVEAPGIALGRRINRWWQPPTAP